MATLSVNATHISNDIEELRSIGKVIDQLLGGDNHIRIHHPASGFHGEKLYKEEADHSKITHGGQEIEGLLAKLNKNLRTKVPTLADAPEFTEGVRILGEGNRWKIDYGQLLKNIQEVATDVDSADVFSVIGDILSKERPLHISTRI